MASLPSFRLPDSALHVSCAAASGCVSAAIGQMVSAHVTPDEFIPPGPVMAAGALGGACLAVPTLAVFRLEPPPTEVLRFARDLITATAAASVGPALGALMADGVGLPLVDPMVALVVGCTGASAICAFAGGVMLAATIARCAT